MLARCSAGVDSSAWCVRADRQSAPAAPPDQRLPARLPVLRHRHADDPARRRLPRLSRHVRRRPAAPMEDRVRQLRAALDDRVPTSTRRQHMDAVALACTSSTSTTPDRLCIGNTGTLSSRNFNVFDIDGSLSGNRGGGFAARAAPRRVRVRELVAAVERVRRARGVDRGHLPARRAAERRGRRRPSRTRTCA